MKKLSDVLLARERDWSPPLAEARGVSRQTINAIGPTVEGMLFLDETAGPSA